MRRPLASAACALLLATGVPAAQPAETTVKLFLVALDDAGRSGRAIGCGDSLVAVERRVPFTRAPLSAAIGELVGLRSPGYGQSGLYNALARSDLKVERVAVSGDRAEVRLTGAIVLGGACDAPRVVAQLTDTALQFPTVKSVDVFVNGTPLDAALALK